MKRTVESARLIAQTFVECGMNATQTYLRLHPEASYETANANGGRIMKEPAVQAELAKLMSVGDRNAEKFLAIQWEFLEQVRGLAEVPPDKLQLSQTASRILAKGYIIEKSDKDKTIPAMSFGDADSSEIENLTGSASGVSGVKRVQ